MDPKKHRMWLRYHLGLKMDRECIRKVEPEIYSDMLRPRLSQCCDKSQDILTDILFEEHHRIVELYRDMNIDLTRSLSRDEKGATEARAQRGRRLETSAEGLFFSPYPFSKNRCGVSIIRRLNS